MEKSNNKVRTIVSVAILAAMVVVLQTFASGIPIGTFNLAFALVPIIVGGALFGPKAGGFLGFVFGVVVLLTDKTAAALSVINPAATIIMVLLKGTAAGFVSGLISSKMRKTHLYPGVILASIATPVCNTGIFITGILLFFRDQLAEWAAGSKNITTFIIVVILFRNFLPELVVDLILSPVIVRIIKAVSGRNGVA